MIDLCLLGTGGTVPLPNRWLTSLLLRCEGSSLLIDCGEGTQITLHHQGYSVKQIDTILLTHFHADHTAGLPGLLLSMAKADRTDPVTIYGPKGLGDILKGVLTVARYIPFELRYREYENREEVFRVGPLEITAFAVKHSVPTFGYTIYVHRNPKFDMEKARALNLPVRMWGLLQKGQTMEYEGKIYTPDMVLGEERRGIKLTYVTDTRPTEFITEHAMGSDLMIAEGMYGDPEKQEKAEYNKHMTMQECARIAAKAGVRELWFTHYSPSMKDPHAYEDDVHSIFANAVISDDGMHKELSFRE
ncbi:MAG TPA: ribonuclease Z [Erysipelotrichaceae bacterium]|nr:ribonuclease Z [Erysipelotrichaceae bacterium]